MYRSDRYKTETKEKMLTLQWKRKEVKNEEKNSKNEKENSNRNIVISNSAIFIISSYGKIL